MHTVSKHDILVKYGRTLINISFRWDQDSTFKEQHLDGVNLLGLLLVQKRRYPLLLRNVESAFMQISSDKLCLEYCTLVPLRYDHVN